MNVGQRAAAVEWTGNWYPNEHSVEKGIRTGTTPSGAGDNGAESLKTTALDELRAEVARAIPLQDHAVLWTRQSWLRGATSRLLR
ncbi:hypothetical protein [Rhizobium leguminosarum]|uniref:hypothetical protein n=1 Tax=Rhizobium leguminosarum TaxID=384 RepID=UPI001C98B940|nr:hypothetical protein [Rhizobium leguminosarum]MBY5530873.1 hypothetical protein [Rhizobium leguminosarum]